MGGITWGTSKTTNPQILQNLEEHKG
jgi:hypothetical protein